MNDAKMTYLDMAKRYTETVVWRIIRRPGGPSSQVDCHDDFDFVEKDGKVIDMSLHHWHDCKVYWTWIHNAQGGWMNFCWDGGRYRIRWDDDGEIITVLGSDTALVEARLRGLYLYSNG